MIEINLVPLEQRKKKKSQVLTGEANIPLDILVGIFGLFISGLLTVHLLLLITNFTKLAQQKHKQKQWNEILPAKENVDVVINEMRTLQANFNAINELFQDSGENWAKKLNILSDTLPRGVWLRKIALTEEMLFIEGSAISRQKTEIFNVHEFTGKLKKENEFLDQLSELELSSMQRKTVNKIEIADFVIKLKRE
ncbi:MAG: PilN domain-containing protein [Candidatus Omnitrophica bacterium]|nr:PilN domain-containing protein [Candidatus Omnitrophota bacterium]